jgi:serine/threonine-protein kinase
MITRERLVKVCDLGLAKRTLGMDPSITSEGFAVGTPFYFSPEVATGRSHGDIRSDIYSLGATLYHLATGRPPFTAPTLAELVTRHVQDRPVWPKLLARELGDGFCQLIARCLEKDPEQRYPAPTALSRDLEALLQAHENRANKTTSSMVHRRPPTARLYHRPA